MIERKIRLGRNLLMAAGAALSLMAAVSLPRAAHAENCNPKVPSTCVGGPTGAPSYPNLKVPLYGQTQYNWCWAATASMIMSYLGTGVGQCTDADAYLGRGDCCSAPVPAACDIPGKPMFLTFDFSSVWTANLAPLTFSQLDGEFSAGRPVAFLYQWPDGEAHWMVAHGINVDSSGTEYVYVNNPEPEGEGDGYTVTYGAWVAGTGYTHEFDIYQIKKL